VIPTYLDLKDNLKEEIRLSKGKDSLYPMYHAMLKRVEKYLDKAMQCQTLVLATLLHPCFRMHLFQVVFGSASSEVTESLQLLKRKFKQTKDQKKELAKNKKSDNLDGEITIVPKPLNPLPGGSSLMSRLALHVELQSEPTTQSDEIRAYLKAKIQFKQGAMHDKTTPLTWWRVRMSYFSCITST
jgi:hypothetical protein